MANTTKDQVDRPLVLKTMAFEFSIEGHRYYTVDQIVELKRQLESLREEFVRDIQRAVTSLVVLNDNTNSLNDITPFILVE